MTDTIIKKRAYAQTADVTGVDIETVKNAVDGDVETGYDVAIAKEFHRQHGNILSDRGVKLMD